MVWCQVNSSLFVWEFCLQKGGLLPFTAMHVELDIIVSREINEAEPENIMYLKEWVHGHKKQTDDHCWLASVKMREMRRLLRPTELPLGGWVTSDVLLHSVRDTYKRILMFSLKTNKYLKYLTNACIMIWLISKE